MTTEQNTALRQHLVALLEGGQAYAKPERILAKVPAEARGRRPDGGDHSLWQLLEHLRISQRDILDFCVAAEYDELKWPDEYWPTSVEPTSESAWDDSVRLFLDDIDEAKRIAADESIDLFTVVPHGSTQTWLRELLLIADHNAHHLGQIITLRKLLGVWSA
jgi:uncharacterized damage-inducible protein DinB